VLGQRFRRHAAACPRLHHKIVGTHVYELYEFFSEPAVANEVLAVFAAADVPLRPVAA
jgi:hypothetical protein